MKKLLFVALFCLLWSFSGFAQSEKEPFEKYVGTARGKFPLTVSGLQRAIAKLDSGVVFIAYPGLWDTTGLGAIPSTIKLNGWLFGSMINTVNLSKIYGAFYQNNVSWDDEPFRLQYQPDPSDSGYTYMERNVAWMFIDVDGTLPLSIYRSGGLKVGMNIMNPNIDVSHSAAELIGIQSIVWGNMPTFNAIQINRLALFSGYFKANDSIDVKKTYGMRISPDYATGEWKTDDYYSYYSGLTDAEYFNLFTVANTAYHFYGNGDYPSYFGGDLQVDGDLDVDGNNFTTGYSDTGNPLFKIQGNTWGGRTSDDVEWFNKQGNLAGDNLYVGFGDFTNAFGNVIATHITLNIPEGWLQFVADSSTFNGFVSMRNDLEVDGDVKIGEGVIRVDGDWWERMIFSTEGDSSWIVFENGVFIRDTGAVANGLTIGLKVNKGVSMESDNAGYIYGIQSFIKNVQTGGNFTGFHRGYSCEVRVEGAAGTTTYNAEVIGLQNNILYSRDDTSAAGKSWYGNRTEIKQYLGTGKFGGTYYGYYNTINPNAVGIGTSYHFYGAGDYPSYFGGDVQIGGNLEVDGAQTLGDNWTWNDSLFKFYNYTRDITNLGDNRILHIDAHFDNSTNTSAMRIWGVAGGVSYNGTGNLTNIYGGLQGMEFGASNNSSATITLQEGVKSLSINSATGTLLQSRAFDAYTWQKPGGTMDLAYNYYSYFEEQGTITLGYHFYGAGDYPSYFGGDLEVDGNVTIGDTSYYPYPPFAGSNYKATLIQSTVSNWNDYTHFYLNVPSLATLQATSTGQYSGGMNQTFIMPDIVAGEGAGDVELTGATAAKYELRFQNANRIISTGMYGTVIENIIDFKGDMATGDFSRIRMMDNQIFSEGGCDITIDDFYGWYLGKPGWATGTLRGDNFYGMYIDASIDVSNFTNPYGIYIDKDIPSYFGGDVETAGDITQKVWSGVMTDGAPLDAEIDAITSSTPAGVGTGWTAIMTDSDGAGGTYRVVSDGTDWFYIELTKAL